MSEVKVNKISPRSGTAFTLGDSGDTFTVPSGATLTTTNATVNLPASVGGLGTGIDVTSQITGVVPAANLGTGTASSSTVLYGDGTYKAESGGAILQVKAGMYYGSDIGSTTSTTPVSLVSLDADYTTATSIAITPASVSSKFHIYAQAPAMINTLGFLFIYRDINGGGYTQLTGGAHYGPVGAYMYGMWNIQYWDAPNTTDEVTYRQYVRAQSGSTIEINQMGGEGGKNGGIITSVTEYDGSIVTISED